MGSTCCKPAEDPDSAWKAQNEAVDANPLYKFINLSCGGRLLDVYLEEGEEALENLIHKELKPYFYNDGKGHYVTIADFCRWKLKAECRAQVYNISVRVLLCQVHTSTFRYLICTVIHLDYYCRFNSLFFF